LKKSPETPPVRWARHYDADEDYADFQELLVWNGKVLLLEPGDASVRALDVANGAVLWTVGRQGAAPGEFVRPDELVDLGARGFGVLDARQGRMTVVDSTGNVTSLITSESVAADLNSLCLLRGAALLAVRYPGMEVVRVDSAGPSVVVDSLYWPNGTYNEVPSLKQGRFAKSHDGHCVLWQAKGDFYSPLSADDGRRFYRYVTPYPEVAIDRSGAVPRALKAPGAAVSAALAGDTLFVLRGSVSRQSNGVVDLYDVKHGQWIKSLAVPADAIGIDVSSDVLVVLAANDRGTRVIAYAR
jgi:hypothetical protein